MRGYIKDYRKEIESDIWMLPPLYHRVWQWLKYTVNHADNEIPMRDGSKILIKRGQHLTSVRDISKAVGWYEGMKRKEPNPKTIDSILKFMVNTNMISIERGQGNRQYTLITLVKYDDYQNENIKGNSKVTADGEGSKQQADINNNDKECLNNDKEVIYDFWNSLEIIQHREFTQKMKSHINARLQKYSQEEIMKAISNYNEIIKGSEYWYTHKFTLEKFMDPKNLVKFLSENKPHENFINRKIEVSSYQKNGTNGKPTIPYAGQKQRGTFSEERYQKALVKAKKLENDVVTDEEYEEFLKLANELEGNPK